MARAITLCVVWIAAFVILAGFCWPRDAGLVSIALAFLGLIHLAVLVMEKIGEPQFFDDMTPKDYEYFCAEILRKSKWEARVTPASGAQGVDFVSEKLRLTNRRAMHEIFKAGRQSCRAGNVRCNCALICTAILCCNR